MRGRLAGASESEPEAGKVKLIAASISPGEALFEVEPPAAAAAAAAPKGILEAAAANSSGEEDEIGE